MRVCPCCLVLQKDEYESRDMERDKEQFNATRTSANTRRPRLYRVTLAPLPQRGIAPYSDENVANLGFGRARRLYVPPFIR